MRKQLKPKEYAGKLIQLHLSGVYSSESSGLGTINALSCRKTMAHGRAKLRFEAAPDSGVACVVVDCESGPVRLGLAGRLAAALRAEYLRLEQLSVDGLRAVAVGKAA